MTEMRNVWFEEIQQRVVQTQAHRTLSIVAASVLKNLASSG